MILGRHNAIKSKCRHEGDKDLSSYQAAESFVPNLRANLKTVQPTQLNIDSQRST